jgi:hypothetical protein
VATLLLLLQFTHGYIMNLSSLILFITITCTTNDRDLTLPYNIYFRFLRPTRLTSICLVVDVIMVCILYSYNAHAPCHSLAGINFASIYPKYSRTCCRQNCFYGRHQILYRNKLCDRFDKLLFFSSTHPCKCLDEK